MSFTHDRIICSLLCDCLFPPLFSSFLLGVYKQYTQLRCIAIAWNFTGIWHMAHGCLDIGHCNKYTSGISYILMEIPTYSYHVDGIQSYTRFTCLQYCVIVPWCRLIFTTFIPYTQCTPYVDILAWIFMYTKCILIVYTTCIHRVSLFYAGYTTIRHLYFF